MSAASFTPARHVEYFLKCLRQLPSPYTSLDTNRLTVAYFCVSALDLLDSLDRVDKPALVRASHRHLRARTQEL